jgi:hypothetical protein
MLGQLGSLNAWNGFGERMVPDRSIMALHFKILMYHLDV